MEVAAGQLSGHNMKCTDAPPFAVDRVYELHSFSEQQVAELLGQYAAQHETIYGLLPHLDVPSVARVVHERTGGLPNLVGICCLVLCDNMVGFLRNWEEWCGANLAVRVQLYGYDSMCNIAARLTRSRKGTRARKLLLELLLSGSCAARRMERHSALVEMLLSYGVASVVDSSEKCIQAWPLCQCNGSITCA